MDPSRPSDELGLKRVAGRSLPINPVLPSAWESKPVQVDNQAVRSQPQIAPPPPSPVWEIPLCVTFYNRMIAFLRALIPLLTGLAIVMAVIVESLRSDGSLDGRFALLVSGWHLGATMLCLGVLMMRTAFVRRPHLVVDPEGLTIHQSGILKRPLRFPQRDIRVAAIDASVPPRQFRIGLRDHRRFPVSAPPGYHGRPLPEWLYSRVGGSPFPLVSHLGDPPNVLLMFNSPVSVDNARRTLKILAAKGPIHVVRPRQETHGLMLRVADPEQARRAFHQHELLGEVIARDVLAVGPSQAQFERARTYNTRANLLVAGLIVLNVGGPMLVEGVGPADEAGVIAPGATAPSASTP